MTRPRPTVDARAENLHRRGLAAIGSGHPGNGARLLRTALRLLGQPDGPAEQAQISKNPFLARILISLAAAEVQLGHGEAGFSLLDRAEVLAAPADLGIVLQQRGLMLMLVGRLDEALRCMNDAQPLIEAAGDPARIARSLLNRAMLHDLAGRIRAALADLDACERIALTDDLQLLLAKARLNRGHCHTLTGDIPAALHAFDTAKAGFARHAPGLLPVLAVDKARALLAAGLVDDAAAELDTALELLAAGHSTHERAEAELTRAQAAIAQGDSPSARTWARRAERRFRRRGNETWAAVSALTVQLAGFRDGRHSSALVAEVTGLATRLDDLGLHSDARLARLLAARACVAAGRPAEAREHLARRAGGRGSIELTLSRHLAVAELCHAEGDPGGVFRHARAGLAALDEHRSRFGSLDLRTGSATLGVELARLATATALASARPARVFAWAERSRAQAFRLHPVRPPADEVTLDLVAELRRRALTARAAELGGRADSAAERRCAELEREIRARGWTARGEGGRATTATFREVAAELAAARSTLAVFLDDGGDLVVLTIADGRARLVRAGRLAAAAELAARLRVDLDTLCGRRLPDRVAAVIAESARYHVEALSAELVAPLRPVLGDRDLVVVPTGQLAAVPWGLLPELRGRPVSVAPSATEWVRGRRRAKRAVSRGTVVVAGPDLRHADEEALHLARLLPGSVVLTGSDASVSRTLGALGAAGTAHLAAHGHHEPSNVLFSRLDLADGPLLAHDIQQLPAVPEHVVLSACDVGRAVVRAGDELLGFTAALLYSGTRSVIAGVARVPDEAVVPLMVRYHRIHSAGVPPARALAEAAGSEPFIPLVCFGSG